MSAQVLPLETRADLRRSVLTHLRRSGRIPGVVYGKGREPVPVAVEEALLVKMQTGQETALVDIELPGQGRLPAVIQEIQRDPVTRKILHVDFHVVMLDEPVDVEVPVQVQGIEEVDKRGLVAQVLLRHLRIRCLPTEIPEHLRVDVSRAEEGDVVRAADVQLPDGAHLLEEADEVVVNISAAGAGAGAGETLPEEPKGPEMVRDTEGKGRRE
ncbi:MAG: 50S ribosomal protein L25 [Kyrpidia tusciae]|nr:50S ribosomal protein L25 [Kyrpidia tusciae]MBE3552154.1 50S ribosomal protein L25 [Kyrpidia tusciae]